MDRRPMFVDVATTEVHDEREEAIFIAHVGRDDPGEVEKSVELGTRGPRGDAAVHRSPIDSVTILMLSLQ